MVTTTQNSPPRKAPRPTPAAPAAVPTAPLAVRCEDPLDAPGWDDALQGFPEATVFHTAAWARVLRDSYGYRPFYFTASRGDAWVGLLPCMEVRSRFTGTRGVCLPFSDSCPPLALDPEAVSALHAAALELARSRGWSYLERREPGDPADPGPPADALEHAVDLTPEPDALMASFQPPVRRALRKAEQAGLEVTVDSALGTVRDFYRLHCHTRRRHGLPPQPFACFRHLHHQLLARGRGFVVTARHRDRPVAAALFLHFGARALFKYGASDPRFHALRGNNRVLWEGMLACRKQGATRLSLGRTLRANVGLLRFKQGWSPTERPLQSRRIDPASGRETPYTPPVFGWHNTLFQRLPIPINRWIGHLLYPHLG